MVRFDTNPERFASVSMLNKLEQSINESIRLDEQILSMDEEILLNPVRLTICIICNKIDNVNRTTSVPKSVLRFVSGLRTLS